MFVDFTDLNKAFPKDSFPLSNIDRLVDSMAKFKFLNSLDANFGYHQIPMHLKNEEKTSFITKEPFVIVPYLLA
jgi:hypothetical protein